MDACTTCRDPQLKIRPRGTACTNDATFENGSSLFLKANVEQRARQVALLYLTLFIKNEIADCRKQKCAHCTLYIHPTMLQQIEGCVPFQNYVDVHPHTSARLNKCPYWDVESIEASLLLLTSGMVEMCWWGEAGFMSNRVGVNHGHGGSVARTLRRHVAYYSNRNAPDVGATSP